MRRLIASVLVVWYALLAMGFHLHVHYCCGQVAEIVINSTHDACSGACNAPSKETQPVEKSCCLADATDKQCTKPVASDHEQQVTKHCCSSDDFYIALKELHQKAQFEINTHPHISKMVRSHVYSSNDEEAPSATQIADAPPSPPFWLLYSQPLFFADEDPADLV